MSFDKDVFLEFVEYDTMGIVQAPPELKNDQRFVLAAINKNVNAFQYVGEELRTNHEFLLAVVKCRGNLLEHIDKSLHNYERNYY